VTTSKLSALELTVELPEALPELLPGQAAAEVEGDCDELVCEGTLKIADVATPTALANSATTTHFLMADAVITDGILLPSI
jgi:hypothetical protein